MSRYGCIGKKLGHSFSKEIHARLADYEYELIELDEQEIEPFFDKREFNALNVTIPYKQTVIKLLDQISGEAARIGAVNTVVNKNGVLYGFNTDYYGMKALIDRLGLELNGKKVLVLGTGGTSKTACVLASDLGASSVLTVSRTAGEGKITYEEAVRNHSDASFIINTTPSGMYPDCEGRPIDISHFNSLLGVVDAVYNPLRTNLVLDARKRGIKAEGGLYMLVMQAVFAIEHFLDKKIDLSLAENVFKELLAVKENIVLTGMPGSGKSTVGRLLDLKGFSFADSDEEIVKRCNCSIRELIEKNGEGHFRGIEAEVIKELSSNVKIVISTGGGAVLNKENITRLKRNGRIFFINASLERLKATEDRPLSNTEDKLKSLYDERIGIYLSTADEVIEDSALPEEIAEQILKKRTEHLA